jgi:non-ribosomal peptide synthetase component F
MAATPSLLINLPKPTSGERTLANMRTIILGGETASPGLLGSCIDAGIETFVAYGLSETTSMGTIHRVEREPYLGKINPSIVGPFRNESAIYLIDENSTQILEENVDGEILIGGAGVAKGYFNDEVRTETHFIHWKGLRVFKTGDYGRWVRGPDGTRVLEFVGRRDRFVKSRGFTVNLDRDVEQQLYLAGMSLGVKSVHSVATKAGIMAVVTPSSVDTNLLLKNARKSMFSHCIPLRVEAVDEIPLSTSGKAYSQKILDNFDTIQDGNSDNAHVDTNPCTTGSSDIAGVEDHIKLSKFLGTAARVLGYPDEAPCRINGMDSFIGLGGTSLLAIKFVSELRKLELHICVRDLLSDQTLSEVAKRASLAIPPNPAARWLTEDLSIARTMAGLRTKACVNLGYDESKFDIGPLTSLQLELSIPTLSDATMNINQVKLKYGREHTAMAEKAWSTVWKIEPVFRTEVSLAIGSGAHIVHKEEIRRPKFLTYVSRKEYEAAVAHADLSVGLGCRLDFISYRPECADKEPGLNGRRFEEREELTVVLTVHHSLMDGSSLEILFENVEQVSKGRLLECKDSSIDANLALISTQRTYDQLARSFFGTYLRDVPVENTASMSRQWRKQRSQTCTAWLTPSVSTEAITNFARKISVSAACIYYCAWAMAISAFEGSDDVVVGSVFSNRTAQMGNERTMGLYMATLPLVFHFWAKSTVESCLKQTMDDMAKMREFAWARSDQVGIGHRLQNILALQFPLPDEGASPPTLRAETFENSDFPLSILVEADGHLRMLYDNHQFDQARIQRIGEHFKYALCSILNEKYIGDCMKINRLHERLLAEADFNRDQERVETVKIALEQSADRFSGLPALENCHGDVLSYKELDDLSNAVAHHINRNLSHVKVVAVFGDGTIQWVISILGILKTGRTFVPIDPKWSIDRRNTVCHESGATVLLFPNDSEESTASSATELEFLCAGRMLNGEFGENNFSRLPGTTTADDDLVAVYTSGSTGIPKGIPLTNRGILALLRSCPEATMFAAPGRRIAQFMSPAFDYCNIEIFGTLLHGATLVLRDPRDPYAHLSRVDTATITPSVLTVLNPDDYPNLEIVSRLGMLNKTTGLICLTDIFHG